jgi:hypothetical protein
MSHGFERSFLLERGFQDAGGAWHREGLLRAATAREEMRVLGDFRVHISPGAFTTVMLARTVARLGGLPAVDAGIIERLPEIDRAQLERLYRELNGYDPPEEA